MKEVRKIKLEDSPLYNLKSKKYLAHLLQIPSTKLLHKFHSSRKSYEIFSISKNGKKEKRPVENPNDFLKFIHKRLQIMLGQIEVPDYLHSGIRGKSHIDNARCHAANPNCVQMDLRHFYQTVRKMYVYQLFVSTFKMAEDIALLLADIATIPPKRSTEAYLPTGSPLSQLLAFWTYKKTFDDINRESKARGIVFTLYVDDMTFSSVKRIPKDFEKFVINRAGYVKLEINREKTKRSFNNKPKMITGCAAINGNLLVRNKKRDEIIRLLDLTNSSDVLREQNRSKIIGKITSQQQVEPGFMSYTKRKEQSRRRKSKRV